MRIIVTGVNGQIATSLKERGKGRADIVALGRPHLDLVDRDSVLDALAATPCEIIINAAAYTAVDKAEQEPDQAMRVNADGAGHVAEAAARLGVPLLHISTDYVFDGEARDPIAKPIRSPNGRLRSIEARWRVARPHDQPNCAILRTAWVYSPFGANFVRTMFRLGETREEVGVVADQHGNPTSALDIADALLVIAARIASDAAPVLRGVFHMTGQGDATWADLAEASFAAAERHGRKAVRVKRIATADYPTLTKRPANSRLYNGKLSRTYGVILPDSRPFFVRLC